MPITVNYQNHNDNWESFRLGESGLANFGITKMQKAVINRAMEVLEQTKSCLKGKLTVQEACAVLSERNFLLLDEKIYKRFISTLGSLQTEAPGAVGLKNTLESSTTRLGSVSPSMALSAEHYLDAFNCGVADLDLWLKKSAHIYQESGQAKTYVICSGDNRVVAYYALGSGAVAQGTATGQGWNNMPAPVPVTVLGRMAVDWAWQGWGLGRTLLRDIILRMQYEGEKERPILVQAITEQAKQFYEHCGFVESSIEPLTLIAMKTEAVPVLCVS